MNLENFYPKIRTYPYSNPEKLVQGLHRGEQQYIADGLAVGQEHAHAVDAEAQATAF